MILLPYMQEGVTRMRKIIFIGILLALLLTGCGRFPEQGPMGTIETATQAVEYDGVLYFLYPSGPVYAPTGIAGYDLQSGTFSTVPGLPEEDVLGLEVHDGLIYYLTSTGLYRCGVHGPQELLVRTDEDGAYQNGWFFSLGRTFVLCRSGIFEEGEDVVSKAQILTYTEEDGLELVRETSSLSLPHGSCVCYWDGWLYYRELQGEDGMETRRMRLSGGNIETVCGWSSDDMFATPDGLLEGSQRITYLPDQTLYCEGRSGTFIGCDGTDLYFMDCKFGTLGEISRVSAGEAEVLVSGFEWDIVTDIKAYVAGQYVLFYSREDLTGTAEPEQTGLVHYLYLLDGKELKQIGSYTQDYLYV